MLTLLDFYAEWCGPCKMLKPVLAKVIKEFEGKVILKEIDGDKNQAEALEREVRGFPTLILLDKEGNELERKVGVRGESELRDWFNHYLKDTKSTTEKTVENKKEKKEEMKDECAGECTCK